MTPEVDTWLTRFAAGAGTLFEWTVTREGYLLARSEAWHSVSDGLCPLTAQQTLEDGSYVPRSQSRRAASTQGLSRKDGTAIMDAADRAFKNASNDEHDLRMIRQRLVTICRVGEKD